MAKKIILLLLPIILTMGCTSNNTPPELTPEQSNFTQTSTYHDVVEVVKYARKNAENMHYQIFGHSEMNKELPLLIFSKRGANTPEKAAKLGCPIVLVVANIHGGEVEGKEALLRLVIDLTQGKYQSWLQKITLLLVPIYNADGNDKISRKHSMHQSGAPKGVGMRANAKGLNLNRDMMKLASSEAQALVQNVLAKWDPALFVDLHSTNGSPHGYHLTYAVPLNPNTDFRIEQFQRNVMMPTLRKQMDKKGWNIFPYGNFETNQPEAGYYTFRPMPYFANNYAGLRNRLGLLSETYSYMDFEQRIAVTEDFIKSVIRFIVRHSRDVQDLLADLKEDYVHYSDSLQAGISYDYTREPCDFNLLISDIDTVYKENSNKKMYKRTGIKDTVASKLYNRFRITAWRSVPFAYALDNRTGAYDHILKNLSMHGIHYFISDLKQKAKVRQFEIDDLERTGKTLQKNSIQKIKGTFNTDYISLHGWVIIPTSNTNRPLIFQLLEPEAEDGYAARNMLGDIFASKPFPVVKVPEPVKLK